MLTKEEIINKIVKGITEQGGINTEGCYYRFSGKRCPIGMLIEDQFYTDNIEGNLVDYSLVQKALQKSGVDTDKYLPLLMSIQKCHDNIYEKKENCTATEVVDKILEATKRYDLVS